MGKRLLNEAPTLAFIIAGIVGLDQSDAQVWQEAVASICSLIVWFTVRNSVDGPVTQVERKRNVKRALAAVAERRDRVNAKSDYGHASPQSLVWLLAVVILVIVLLRVA